MADKIYGMQTWLVAAVAWGLSDDVGRYILEEQFCLYLGMLS